MTPQANTLYQQACTLEYQKDLQGAANKILEALKLTGDDPMLYTKLAGIYTDMDKYDEAIAAYEKVIKLRPDDAFVYISLGNIYETQGKYQEALGAYKSALQIFFRLLTS